MATIDEVFEREVKLALREIPKVRDLRKLPLPPEAAGWPKIGVTEYKVNGINDPVFSGLNGAIVRKIPGKVLGRVIEEWGEYRVGEDGKEVWEEKATPGGCVAVASTRALEMPWGYEAESKNGLGYVDYMESRGGTRWFLYFIPKGNLYLMNKAALVVSTKNQLRLYEGVSFKTWGFGKLTVAVINYKPGKTYDNTIILSVKPSLDFGEEVNILAEYWEAVGVISNPKDFETELGDNLLVSEVVANEEEFVAVLDEPVGDQEFSELDLDSVRLNIPD